MDFDFLIDFFTFVVQVIFWYFVINLVIDLLAGFYIKHKSEKKEIEAQIVERLNEIVHQVEIDQHNDMYYWFDSDNHEFLVQGRTTEEIIQSLKQRFSDHVFLLNNEKIMAGPEFAMLEATPENLALILDRNKSLIKILDR
jgi:hypothetical protein